MYLKIEKVGGLLYLVHSKVMIGINLKFGADLADDKRLSVFTLVLPVLLQLQTKIAWLPKTFNLLSESFGSNSSFSVLSKNNTPFRLLFTVLTGISFQQRVFWRCMQ